MPEYPGAGLPLRHPLCSPREGWSQEGTLFYRTGHNSFCVGAETEMMTIREVAMLNLMDHLTDKPDWDRDVFNDDTVAEWRQETFSRSEVELFNAITPDKDDYDETEDGLFPTVICQPKRCRLISDKAFDYVSIIFSSDSRPFH
jgi:hypothetical protein